MTIFSRPQATPAADWAEIDTGPGYMDLPAGHEFGFRIHNCDDETLKILVKELAIVDPLTYANLSENRKITEDGIELLKVFTRLSWINLSSCGLSNDALAHLTGFTHLVTLDISYCNRLTGLALKYVQAMPNLKNVNLQGCVKITTRDVSSLRKFGISVKK
jgi:hypothetical protein